MSEEPGLLTPFFMEQHAAHDFEGCIILLETSPLPEEGLPQFLLTSISYLCKLWSIPWSSTNKSVMSSTLTAFERIKSSFSFLVTLSFSWAKRLWGLSLLIMVATFFLPYTSIFKLFFCQRENTVCQIQGKWHLWEGSSAFTTASDVALTLGVLICTVRLLGWVTHFTKLCFYELGGKYMTFNSK